MKRGGKFLVSTTVVGGCCLRRRAGQARDPVDADAACAECEAPVPFRIAEARGQLALGNVALALEGFRKAAREDPNSIDALAGMADLLRPDGPVRSFAPQLRGGARASSGRTSSCSAAFAASLQLQGESAEALQRARRKSRRTGWLQQRAWNGAVAAAISPAVQLRGPGARCRRQQPSPSL